MASGASLNVAQAEKYNLTYREAFLTRDQLVRHTHAFLGQIGGLCHMVLQQGSAKVSSSAGLTSWDFGSKLMFSLPILSKKVDINLNRLLQKVIALATGHPSDEVKSISSELLHAIIVFSIGKSAEKAQQAWKLKSEQAKTDNRQFFRKVFPAIFKIGCNNSHPSHLLINALCF